MRRLISIWVIVCMMLTTAVSVFAWTDADIVTVGGKDIIVPLQKPEITVESAFAIDETIADHNGEYGKVYRGKVDVSKEQKKNKLLSFNNFHFNEGRYRISFWFMEDAENSDILTRMIRPMTNMNNDSTTLKGIGNSYILFFNSKGEKIMENDQVVGVKYRADKEIRGVWKKYEMDFEVSSSTNSTWLGNPNVVFSWECVGKYEDEGKKYADKFINGDIHILFSDVKLFKYPSEDFAFNGVDSEDSEEFRADFSAPVDLDRIESVKINGVEKSREELNIKNEDNTLVLSPKLGFAPGRDYTVSLTGVYDIFERKYDDEVSGSVSVKDYLDVEYNGISDNQNIFDITNNMGRNANLLVVVFYYNDNNIKKIAYSSPVTIPSKDMDCVKVTVPDGVEGLSAKAHIWDADMLPMPLALEISLD